VEKGAVTFQEERGLSQKTVGKPPIATWKETKPNEKKREGGSLVTLKTPLESRIEEAGKQSELGKNAGYLTISGTRLRRELLKDEECHTVMKKRTNSAH